MTKRIILAGGLPLALLALSGCSTYDGYGYGGYGYGGYGGYDDYGAGAYYNEPYYGGGGLSYYDGYYDNFYGPVHGGYWAPDGYFWYQSRSNGPYLRDHYRHFRRDSWGSARHFRFPNRDYRDNRDWSDRGRDRDTPRLFEGQLRDRDRDGRDWTGDRDRDGGRNRDDGNRGDRGRNNSGWSDGNRDRPPAQDANAGPPRGDGDDRGGRSRGGDQPRDRGDRGGEGGGRGGEGGGNRGGEEGAREGGGEHRTPSLWRNRPN